MNRTAALTLIFAWPALAGGQTVFFDDFTGPALLPHWSTPPAWHWDYNFNNGMLNVTGLHFPNSPHFAGNSAAIEASFAPQTDFHADVWLGWNQGDIPHRLAVSILGPTGSIIGGLMYTKEDPLHPTQFLMAHAGSASAGEAAPLSGMHQFTIQRTGSEWRFELNGAPVAALPDVTGIAAAGIRLEFGGPATGSGTFGTLYVDRIHIVPAPGAGLIFAGIAAVIACRRRRPSQPSPSL